MPVTGLGTFIAGVAAGWAARSVAGSTREALVRAIVAGHEARADLRRAVAERLEWIEDLMAEGRIRFDDGGAREPPQTPRHDPDAPSYEVEPPSHDAAPREGGRAA